MIELKKLNVHRIVEAKEEALRLLSNGFEVVKDELNILEMKIEKVSIEPVANEEPNILEIKAKEVSTGQVDYNSMTLDQLKGLCKDNNLEGYTALNKEDLIKFMQENIK